MKCQKIYYICVFLICNYAISQTVFQPKVIDWMDDITSEPSGVNVVYNPTSGHYEYWTHNDAGNPENIYNFRLNAVGNIIKTIDVGVPFIDWEDMATDDLNNVYLGDFGNFVHNVSVNNPPLQVVKIPNPNNYSGTAPSSEIIEYIYPTNGVLDSEAMVHFNGALYIFTKTVSTVRDPSLDDNYTYCYKIPDTPLLGGGKYTATYQDAHQVVMPGEDPTHFKVTGADLSPDKKKLVLLTYERIWVFSCFEGDDFFNGTVTSFLIPFRQYEGVTFINNHEIVITKEGSLADPNYNPRAFYMDLFPWIDGSCIECNKLNNGNFDESNFGWTGYIHSSADAGFNFFNGSAEIDIQTIGSSQWHVSLRQRGLVLGKNKTYRISYKAYAEDDRLVSVYVNDNNEGSQYYTSQAITTVPTYYSHEFTMGNVDVFNGYLNFGVGNYIAHKVYFDDVKIEEVDCICPQNRYFFAKIDNTTKHFETNNNIYGYNTIEGDSIIYDAANCVELFPGFEVKQGAAFDVYSDGCGGY